MPQTWLAYLLGRLQRRRPRCSATRRIGTNLGVSLASRDELVAAGTPSPAPQRRSSERWIHLKTRFALTPFARATPATDAPGLRAASTIRRRSATLQDRRFLRAPPSTPGPTPFDPAAVVIRCPPNRSVD